ncbi:MAG: DNA topoisomerase I [Desulfurococcaceae archaeon]
MVALIGERPARPSTVPFEDGEGGAYTSIWELEGKVLVIAEKPKAARKIAEALSEKYVVRKHGNVLYYEIREGDHYIVVASAAGHLYELHTDVPGYPVFDYSWVPAHIVNEEKKHVKSYLDLLSTLFRTCQYYVNACDYDVEGSVIGYLLIKLHGDEKRALRARFSSLTIPELKSSFTKLTRLDYEMIEAGLCRHELDWIWGINISRALMKALYTCTGRKVILSAGRVQTPTLKYVVDHEIKKKLFIPLPQYSITVTLKKGSTTILAEFSSNPVLREVDAKSLKSRIESSGYLVVKQCSVSGQKHGPPPPFKLSDLQEEAARIYGFSPMKTQEIAEQLYLDALISYPRTNSQKLPPTINYKEIMDKLARLEKYRELVLRLLAETKNVLKPVEGEKEDPAHPAIHPTGVTPRELTREQAAIYDLIVRRFLAAFAQHAVISRVKVTFTTLDGLHDFSATGLNVEYPGWMVYYPFHKPSTRTIPALKQGEKLEVVKVTLRETYTKPPPRLKKIDILRWMEDVGVGTESTRAIIIEKLFERGYLKNAKTGIEVSDLGIGVIEVIERFFPDLVSVELTRTFEVLMNDIVKGLRRREHVIMEAKRVLVDLLTRFNSYINDAGLLLAKKLSLVDNYAKCIIPGCRGDAYKDKLCKVHYAAYEALIQGYSEWRSRKSISFDNYVSKLAEMGSTGKYVKDVIKYYMPRAGSKVGANA